MLLCKEEKDVWREASQAGLTCALTMGTEETELGEDMQARDVEGRWLREGWWELQHAELTMVV